MLYLIATPIGNLADLSFRAIETLRNCDYLLCEDTRRTRILLNHYDISAPLKSYHMHNEKKKLPQILHDLEAGLILGLVSDAGTVGISDPGHLLVKRCVEQQIEICSVPGPCAAISALVTSGLSTSRFQFFGFLPKKKGKLRRAIEEMRQYPVKSKILCKFASSVSV